MRPVRIRPRVRLLALLIIFSLVGSTGAAISLASADGMVMTGRITAPDGTTGVAGATVAFLSWTTGEFVDSAQRVTAADGSYSTVLPSDEYGYELHATPPADDPHFFGAVVDYGPGYDGFQVTDAGISGHVTTLTAPTLVGTVLDASGQPLAGATVSGGQSWKPVTVTSRADGSYGLVLRPYSQTIQGTPPPGDLGKHALTSRTVQIPWDGTALRYDLTLDAATLSGRVLLPDGTTPAQGALVHATLQAGGFTSAYADSTGFFGLAMPPGSYTVHARPADADAARSLPTQVPATSPGSGLLDIVLPAPNVTGTVSGPGGEPLTRDIAISVRDAVTKAQVGGTFYAKSAADHGFGFALPPGRHVIRAHAPRAESNPHRWQSSEQEVTVEEGAVVPALHLELQPEGTAAWRAVQVNTAADGGAAEHGAGRPSVSADGTTVAFTSYADDLVEGTTGNDYEHLYVRRVTADGLEPTELVDVAADGGFADRGVYSFEGDTVGSLSADGSLVAFASYATNLVGPATDRTHVYLRDLSTDTTVRLSQTAAGVEADGGSWAPSLSDDGQRVVFITQSDNLAGTTSENAVVLLDRSTGTFTKLSDESYAPPVLSADGSTVAWVEDRWDTTTDDTIRAVRVHRVGGATADVPPPTSRVEDQDRPDYMSDGSVTISADGGTVAFTTTSEAEDRERVWLYDTATAVRTEVHPFDGVDVESNNGVQLDLTPDGRSLLFTADQPYDAVVSSQQVWHKDLVTGRTTVVTGGAGGDGGDSTSQRPQAAANGAVVLESGAPDLVRSPIGPTSRIYLARPSTDAGAPLWPSDAALAAEDVSTSFFRLVWPAAQDDALTGYTVLLDGTELGRVGPLTTGFQVTGLTPATAYDLEVRATDAFGNVTVPGLTATLHTASPPLEPGTAVLSASPEGSAVRLVWDAETGSEDATYVVRRRSGDSEWQDVSGALPLSTPSYVDAGVPAGADLTYAVHLISGDTTVRHTLERSVTTPELSLLSTRWSTPLLGVGLARLGGTLVVTAEADPGREASARIVVRSWYDEAGSRLSNPAERTVTVPLTEQTEAGTYRGTWTVAEGTAEIVRVEALLEDGHGAVVSRTAVAAPLPVSGAVELEVDSPPGVLDGARTVLWSDSLRAGTALSWAGSPVRVVLPAASDHDLQLVAADGFAVGRRTVQVLPGLTTHPERMVVTAPAQVHATVRAGDQPVRYADVVVTDTATGDFLASGSTDGDGLVELTDRLRDGREVTVTATLSRHLPYLSTASSTVTLGAGQNDVEVTASPLPTGRVTGLVSTSTGGPAGKAQVTVTQSVEGRGFTWRGETTPDGRFAVAALAGPALVTVGWRGLPAEREVTIPDNGDVVADVTLPRWTSYPVDVDVFTRLHGASEYNGPLPLDLPTLNDLFLTVRGPQGHISPRGADGSNTLLVAGRAGDAVEVCASMPFKHLPQVCETATLPESVETPTTIEVRLSAPAAVAASIADAAGTLFTGTWDATVTRAVAEGSEVVASQSGSGNRLSLSLPGDGDYTLSVTSEGLSAARTVTVASGGVTSAGQLRLTASEHFSAPENEVLPIRTTVRPGDLADFRASWRSGDTPLQQGVLRLTVPAGTTVLPAGLTLDGAPVTGTAGDGFVDIALGDLAPGATGVVRYQVRVPDRGAGTLLGAATMRFTGGEEPLRPSLVRVESVTLKLPEQLTRRTTTASGRAPAGTVVRLVAGGAVLGTATATAAGYWRAPVELPAAPGARSYSVQAEARSGESVLRSAPAVVHYDPAAPALTRMTLERGGYEHSWNPQDGVATFPFTWVVGDETFVTAEFSDPDLVRNVVFDLGGAKGYARRVGDAFVADVPRANGRGDIRITYDTVQPWVGLPTTELGEEDTRAGLPAALRDFVAQPPGAGEAVPGSGAGVATVTVPQLGDAAQLRTELSVTSVDYTPTAQDRAVEQAIGIPLWNVQLGEDAEGRTTVDFYMPASAAPVGSALRTAALRSVRASAVAAAGNALHVVLKNGLMGADAVNSVNDSTSVFNDSSGADKKYAAINELSEKVATCASTQSGPVLQKLEQLVNLAGYADAASVGMTIAGLVLGPETLGASLVVTLIGLGTGKAMDGIVGYATDQVAKEVEALGCPPPPGGGKSGAAGGDAVGAPVYIHDPSGYVYEGMPSQRVAGATATLLHSPTPTGPWTVWDAEWFGQSNPLITGTDGRYAWDVPEDFWQVRWTKDGYEPALSEVLEVLPPRFDVNGGLVRLTPPELSGTTAAQGGVVDLVFDRAMRVLTVGTERVTVTNGAGVAVPGTVAPVGAEASPVDGTALARTFRFTPTSPVAGGTLRVEVGELAQSYAARPLTATAVREVTVPVSGGTGGAPAPTTPTVPTVPTEPVPPTQPPTVPGQAYVEGEPKRVLDSRTGTGTRQTRQTGVVTLDLAGVVPPGTGTVLLNLTATNGAAAGHVTAYPHGSPLPRTSNLNFAPNRTQANLVAVALGEDSSVDLRVHGGPVHLIADLVGQYMDPAAPVGLHRRVMGVDGARSTLVTGAPERLLDSRNGMGTRTGHKTGRVTLTLPDTVPDDADSVLLNLTATGARGDGHVTSYASGTPKPGTSSLNFTPGATQANLVLVQLGEGRRLTLDVHAGPTHLVADLVGWFTGPTAETPTRVLDTRRTGTAVRGPVTVALHDVPERATSVLVNLTATAALAPGHVTAHQFGTPLPRTSNLNFTWKTSQANLAVVPLGGLPRIVLGVHAGPTHLIADVVGYHR